VLVGISATSEFVDVRVLNEQSSGPSAALVDLPVTVAVSTIGARLSRLVLPPPCPGIDYLILAQKAEGLPCPAGIVERGDCTVNILRFNCANLRRRNHGWEQSVSRDSENACFARPLHECTLLAYRLAT